MSAKRLPARQVHLDFHTSEHIADVGKRFGEKQFQSALKIGRVNSITVFAKCHHSWSYYPTKVGRAHPNLKVADLMGRQIAAAHAVGVRAPIYYTVGWSANDAEGHPEWVVRDRDGKPQAVNWDFGAKPSDARAVCSWKFLDPTGGYKEHMLEQVREICRLYPVDGFFFDICHGPVSLAPHRIEAMRGMGLDPDRPADLVEFKTRTWVSFMSEARAAVLSMHPEATVFFNGVAGVDQDERYHQQQTHFELEDLPTTWGGYDRFPPRAKFFHNFGKPLLAMSGKFHTMWGEFGGYKHPDAIRFEAAGMVAYGAACSFGDQMHPSGEMDLETYRNIGAGYEYVKRIEKYGVGARPCSDLGVYPTLAESGKRGHGVAQDLNDQGVANMLMEGQVDFEVVPRGGDLRKYQTIILGGGRCLSEAEADRLVDYVEDGGSLLVLGESVLERGEERMVIDVGAEYLGPGRFEIDYSVVGREIGKGLVKAPFLNYSAAVRVKATSGKSLGSIREPYFDRTYGKYCSHQNTPYREEEAGTAVGVRKGRIVYLAHALGKMYYQHGARVHRDLFLNALKLVYRRPRLEVSLPSAGRVNLGWQEEQRRYVVHLMYGPPIQRGRCAVIEDLVPLRDVEVRLRVGEKIRKAWLPVSGKKLAVKREKGVVRVRVPVVRGHEVVAFEY